MSIRELQQDQASMQRAVNALSIMYASASLYVEYMEEYHDILTKYNVKDPCKHEEQCLRNSFAVVNKSVSKAINEQGGEALCDDWDALEAILRDFFLTRDADSSLAITRHLEQCPLADVQRVYLAARNELNERINKNN